MPHHRLHQIRQALHACAVILLLPRQGAAQVAQAGVRAAHGGIMRPHVAPESRRKRYLGVEHPVLQLFGISEHLIALPQQNIRVLFIVIILLLNSGILKVFHYLCSIIKGFTGDCLRI